MQLKSILALGVVVVSETALAQPELCGCTTCDSFVDDFGRTIPVCENCADVDDVTGEVDFSGCCEESLADLLCEIVCCAHPDELGEWPMTGDEIVAFLCELASQCENIAANIPCEDIAAMIEECPGIVLTPAQRERLEACTGCDADEDDSIAVGAATSSMGGPNGGGNTGNGSGGTGPDDEDCGVGVPGGGSGGGLRRLPPPYGSPALGSPPGGQEGEDTEFRMDPGYSTQPFPVSDEPVDLASGRKIERATDLVVRLRGPDFVLSREYISDSDAYALDAPDLVGHNWMLSVFKFIDVDTGGTDPVITLFGPSLKMKLVYTKSGSVWKTVGSSQQYFEQTTQDIGGTTYNVWRLVHPGSWELDFYRTGGNTPAELEGLIAQQRDLHGNAHTFDYTLFGTGGSKNARLTSIYLNGTNDINAEAELRFDWIITDDTAYTEINGLLQSVAVYRPGGSGPVLTQWVSYRYFDQYDQNLGWFDPILSADLGADDDLIEVVHGQLVDPESGAAEDLFRTRYTHYRYHDGNANSETDERLDADGLARQLKLVIYPEQIEYVAQQLNSGSAAPDDGETNDALVETAWSLLEHDDDEEIGTLGIDLIDLAGKVIDYDIAGSADGMVEHQFIQAGCGCSSSAPQGIKLSYSYLDFTDDATTVVTEYLENGSGGYNSTAHRKTYFDMEKIGTDDIPYLVTVAIEDGASATTQWVWHYEVDSDGNVTRAMMPSALSSYTEADTSPASYAASTTSGLVYAYDYNSDHRLTEIRVGEGDLASFSSFTHVVKVTYRTDARDWLPDKVEWYRDETSTAADDVETVTYDYGFHSGDKIAWTKVSLEAELVAENGPSTGSTTYDTYRLFDDEGFNTWTRAPDKALVFRKYDATTGEVTKVVRNADPAGPDGVTADALDGSDYANLTVTGWGRSADGGELVTDITLDDLGRVVKTVSPGGTSAVIQRRLRPNSERQGMNYYSVLRFPHKLGDNTFDGPVRETIYNAAGQMIRRSDYEVSSTGYDPVNGSFTLGTELSRSTRVHAMNGTPTASRIWNSVSGDTYDETTFEYDAAGRVTELENAVGTVTAYAYDVLGRVTSVSVGTTSANAEVVEERYYDHTMNAGDPEQGVGDGNLTYIRRNTGEASPDDERDTIRTFDYRNRLETVDNSEAPHEFIEYDNLDRITARAAFAGTAPPSAIHGSLSNRGVYLEIEYSQRGRSYVQRVAIDPTADSDPAQLDYLETHSWYDEVGRRIAHWAPNGPATKSEYDGLGRSDIAYVSDRGGDAAPGATDNHSDASAVTDDVVFHQVEISFDSDDTRWAGLPYLVTTRHRSHDASYSTETGSLDDTNSVVTYTGSYYDDADRQIRSITWGTNHDDGFESGGESPVDDVTYDWPPTSAPEHDTSPYNTGDTIVMARTYNTRGLIETRTDSEGHATKTLFDDRNRLYATIENYKNATVTWSGGRWNAANIEQDGTVGGNDEPGSDRVTSFIYDGVSNLTKQSAHLPDGSNGDTIQTTEYVYGVTDGVHTNDTDSLIDSNGLLQEVRYPDETTGSPGTTAQYKVQYAYNMLGEMRARTDQNGTIHTYDRNLVGRVTKDWVTTFGTDVDGQGMDIDTRVKGIEFSFDGLGRIGSVESLDSSSGVLNGIEFKYNPLWQVAEVFQDSEGEVTYIESNGVRTPTGDTEVVRYTYSESEADNHSRVASMTYPDGSVLEYTYGSSDADDTISRVTKLSIGPDTSNQTDIVLYSHVGLGMFAEVDYAVPDIQLDRTASHEGKRRTQGQTSQAAGTYPAWDRFGRVVRHMWVDGGFDEHATSTTEPKLPPILELTHTYDRSSNRLTRYDGRTGASMPNWEFEYEYDGLDRLEDADRGEWDGSSFDPDAGTQEWTLDILGNWTEFLHDKDGDGNYTDSGEDEDRTHNEANEVSTVALNGLFGSPFTQHRDKAGNWTRAQRSAANKPRYTHDAWNRLVKVEQLGTLPISTQGEYEYNGLHWRVVREFANGANTEERRMYYSGAWQLLEERIDTDNSTWGEEKCAQTVWGLRYIDDAVLRRTDTNQDYDYSDSGERNDYSITDPQFSVVAVVDDTGALQERVVYSAYGEAAHHYPADMDGDGDVDSSDTNWFVNLSNLKSISQSGYNADGDLNRDGTVNSSDATIANGWGSTSALADGLLSDPSGPDNPIGYDGYVFNAETKLYTVRFRHYEPVMGRWLERDPALYIDGMNLYEAVRSVPTALSDPTGRYSLTVEDPPYDDLDYLIDSLEATGNSPLLWNGAHGTKELVDRLNCHAAYLECLAQCVADDPEKLLNALAAAGFNIVGGDLVDWDAAAGALGEILGFLFKYLELDAETGEFEFDSEEMAAELMERAGSEVERACENVLGAEEQVQDAVERFLRDGAQNPEHGDNLIDRLRDGKGRVKDLNKLSRWQRAWQAAANGTRVFDKVNAYTAVASAAWDALKELQEQCGDQCDSDEPCP